MLRMMSQSGIRTSFHLSWCLVLAGCQGAGGSDEVAETGSTESTDSSTGSETETGIDTETSTDTETGSEEVDILEQLQAIEGMSVEELPPLQGPRGEIRLFDLHYLQPADHANPEGPWFEQHVYLQHVGVASPMVLFTTGYDMYLESSYRSEPATLLLANQLTTEQRFFGTSRPDPLDWNLLTIEQAAADHHRIVEALQPIYQASWLSTGGSKGGMTSVYHRRFHPDDVDATIAYVAPHSFSLADERYPIYLEEIGDPICAQALRDLQVEALSRRAALMTLLIQTALAENYTFQRVGSYELVFESAVVDLRWAFWQRSGKEWCDSIPSPLTSDGGIHNFINTHVRYRSYDDARIDVFEPYYYQATHQLGSSTITEPHLEGLLEHPIETDWDSYIPAGTTVDHDPAAMLDISEWLASEGERLMFIYGEWDPWSGGAFDPTGAADTHIYWVAEQDHNEATLSNLPSDEFEQAMTTLLGWTGMNLDLDETSARRAEVVPQPAPHGLLPR